MEQSYLESVVAVILWVASVYGLMGIVVAFYLHALVLHRIDPSTKGAGIVFRLFITPGLALLWPLMVWKYSRFRRGHGAFGGVESPFAPRRLRSIHGLLIIVAAIFLPVALGAAVYFRASDPVQAISAEESVGR